MTNKEKAEAYVRSQLPELMELSAGCMIALENYDGLRVVDVGVKGNDAILCYDLNDGSVETNYKTDKSLRIIGHPIQLQHWLRVLGTKGIYEIQNRETLIITMHGTGGRIVFNLTTGQPATEADYKAFNDIVGV